MTLFIEMTQSYDPTKKLSLRLRPELVVGEILNRSGHTVPRPFLSDIKKIPKNCSFDRSLCDRTLIFEVNVTILTTA